jgi:norsolorinic acid ketoreductase
LLTKETSQLISDFTVNTIGPIMLYQAFASLLSRSDAPGGAKFVIVSSPLSQTADSMPLDFDAYGISKVGANYMAKKLDQMDRKLIAFPIA